MSSTSRLIARRLGWVEAAPGYWAWGAWRIQRLTGGRSWRWWYVVAGGPDGRARTMRGAIEAVHAASEEAYA